MAPLLDNQNSEDNQASFRDGSDQKLVHEPLLSIVVPPDSLIKFKESYEEEALKWPSDLAVTTDYRKLEQFVSSAHSLVRKWLPQDLIFRLESFMHDPSQPSALIIRGLPIDDNLPPSTPEGHRWKNASLQFMSETWLVGIARIVGQPFIYEFLAQAGRAAKGMGLLIRELYPMPEQEKAVSALGSREFLDFHVDGFSVLPQCYPNCLVFIGLRGDPSKVGKTLLCDFRELYSELDPEAIAILRKEKITWKSSSKLQGSAGFCKHIVEGTEANPVINIYDESIGKSVEFHEAVGGSAAAVAAYRHAKEVARKVGGQREGVWLDAGDMLLVNQRRMAHARTSFAATYEGKDRWMQRVYVNEGAIWEPTGLVPWPVRALPFQAAQQA